MSQERLPVRKIREVLRLHHEAGLSNRAIARVCKISNSVLGVRLLRSTRISDISHFVGYFCHFFCLSFVIYTKV